MLTFPPDYTFVVQIASFLVLWFGLKRLLFDPMLRVLEERQARTAGTAAEATALQADADRSAAEYERRIQQVRHELAAETDAVRAAARADEQRIIAEAREHVGNELARLRDTLRTQADAARPALGAEARDLAQRLLQQAIGREVA